MSSSSTVLSFHGRNSSLKFLPTKSTLSLSRTRRLSTRNSVRQLHGNREVRADRVTSVVNKRKKDDGEVRGIVVFVEVREVDVVHGSLRDWVIRCRGPKETVNFFQCPSVLYDFSPRFYYRFFRVHNYARVSYSKKIDTIGFVISIATLWC